MNSEQTCPLCNNQIIPSIDRKGYWFCTDQSGTCMIHHKRYTIKYFNDLSSQISRIKQEAKQEVFDDIEEISTTYYSGYLKGCRRYFISKFEEIKKKHLPSQSKDTLGEHGVE